MLVDIIMWRADIVALLQKGLQWIFVFAACTSLLCFVISIQHPSLFVNFHYYAGTFIE